jgi:hypothetical protein
MRDIPGEILSFNCRWRLNQLEEKQRFNNEANILWRAA